MTSIAALQTLKGKWYNMGAKLIAVDCDGTLYDNKSRISEKNLFAMERAAGNGVYIVPATGRSYDELPVELARMDCIKYYILSNGACVMSAEKEILFTNEIPQDIGDEIMAALKKCEVLPEIYTGGTPYVQENQRNIETYKYFGIHPKYFGVLTDTRKGVENIFDFYSEKKPAVEKFNLFFKNVDGRSDFIRQVQDLVDENKIEITSSMTQNLEVNNAGANKGSGLNALCRVLGIDISQSVAVGDSNNDITMVKAAGVGVAVANACASLIDVADEITLSNEESAVAAVIEKFVLRG